MTKDLYTIGYASFTMDDFITALKRYAVTAVADVRSAPYSRYKPDFSKETLHRHLAASGIAYLFTGHLLGARIHNTEVYQDGKLSYSRLAGSDFWREGISRILDEGKKQTLAIMCAEKDPATCHRTFLVCRTLRAYPFRILHILGDGSLEEHAVTEGRLVELYGADQGDLFQPGRAGIEAVYDRMCERIPLSET